MPPALYPRVVVREVAPLSAISLAVVFFFTIYAHADDIVSQVKKAVEGSTLSQTGTPPFHLRATYSPSLERDKDSHREGAVEFWWASPTRYRREITSPEFHQVLIVDGSRQWQKNEGDYFPEWLRELAVAIVQPVPIPIGVLLERAKSAEVRQIHLPSKSGPDTHQTNIEWPEINRATDFQANGKGHLALLNGQLFYTGGAGWDGLYHDFEDFHGRSIARTVSSGHIEVTAKIAVLEDLGAVSADLFNAAATGTDEPIEVAILDETSLRKNLVSAATPVAWPAIKDGPLEGIVWTEVVIDRTGHIREMIPPIADNAGVNDTAVEAFRAMTFKPFLRNGVAVQASGRLSMPFKTVRPAGVETFDNARNYFERARKLSFLGTGADAPYTLHAEFQTGSPSGLQTGRYEDTWISPTQWKREAWFASSHLVRSQDGAQHYVLSEGPAVPLLRLLMRAIEPIPAGDTMTESDWRIRRDTIGTANLIRVLRGPEGSNGELDPKTSEGYWFASDGQLVKVYTSGLDLRPAQVEPYGGVQVARQIDVLKDGKLGMRISITQISSANPDSAKSFRLKGHEWQRAFTAEVR